MTNQEIIDRIEDLLQQRLNYCDFEIELLKLEKEYKKSDFFKQTRISLQDLVNKYRADKIFNLFDLDKLFITLQEKIEELDVDNLLKVLNKLQETFAVDLENNNNIYQKFSKLILQDKGE